MNQTSFDALKELPNEFDPYAKLGPLGAYSRDFARVGRNPRTSTARRLGVGGELGMANLYRRIGNFDMKVDKYVPTDSNRRRCPGILLDGEDFRCCARKRKEVSDSTKRMRTSIDEYYDLYAGSPVASRSECYFVRVP